MIDSFLSAARGFGAIAGFMVACYLGAACAGHVLIRLLGHTRFARSRLQPMPPARQMLGELRGSVLAILLVALLLTAAWLMGGAQLNAVYFSVATHGWVYLAGSVVIVATVHDGYACLTRHVLPRAPLFEHLRRRRPAQVNPTMLAAWALDPAEVLLGAAWCLPLASVLPLHPLAVAAYVALLSMRNALCHLGYAYCQSPPGGATGTARATALSLRA
ncbi:MAG: hypothetical protein ABIT83_03765 [Massilia sp.]